MGAPVFKTGETEHLGLAGSIPVRLRHARSGSEREVVMGDQDPRRGIPRTDALLALPAVLLIAFGFASLGMAVTSYMKTFQHMDWINFVLLPMFLFSATLYPITVYPEAIQTVIRALPLWHGVELMRQLSVGVFTSATVGHVAYFGVMTVVGVLAAALRLRRLFLR